MDGLQQRIEICSPLSLVILMLGTNDFQFCHPYNDAWAAAQGIATLVHEIRTSPIEPGMPVPPILILCPPRLVHHRDRWRRSSGELRRDARACQRLI
jgi:hypothetical protein